MTRAERWFLDANVWNGLVDHSTTLTRSRLSAAVRAGRIEIVGSFELYEELLGTATRNPDKYRAMSRLFDRFCARTVLVPLRERYRAEIRAGGALPKDLRYVSRSDVKRRTAMSPGSLVDEANDLIYEFKVRSTEQAKALKASLQAKLVATGRKATAFDRRVPTSVIDESANGLLRDMAAGDVDRPAEVQLATAPSVWLTAAGVAGFATLAIENRRLSGSESHDITHCSAGAYFDVLVTKDGPFLEALSVIDGLPFEFIRPDEAAERLAR